VGKTIALSIIAAGRSALWASAHLAGQSAMGPLGMVEVDPVADDAFDSDAVGLFVRVDRLEFERSRFLRSISEGYLVLVGTIVVRGRC